MFSRDHYRALHEAAGVLQRSDRGRIVLRGADRKAYLHGLLSNDVQSLEAGAWCYATLLTAQGRMISDMRVFELGDTILLDLEREVTPAVREHLDRFVIAEDVTVEDVTERFAQVGVYGPEARRVVDAAIADGLAVEPRFVLPSRDLGVEGLDLVLPAAAADDAIARLERHGAVRIDAAAADVTRIEAGIPKFLVDMDASTIPLEAGIEDRAISMTKGCYVGQEVIVRVLHRGGGRVAKKLAGLVIDGPGVAPGDVVFAGDRDIGKVTSATESPRVGKAIALAYLQRDFLTAGTAVRIKTTAGEQPAVVVNLPFER